MMRNTLTILFCVCASFFLGAQNNNASNESTAVISFDEDIFYFDSVFQGDTVIHEFRFKNIGKSPLLLTDVYSSCGCVTSHYSKAPVPPGQSGIIRMEFRTTAKSGPQDKTLWVKSNASNGDWVLHMKGTIILHTPISSPANLKSGAPKLSEAVDPSAPKIVFDTTTYWFDTVYQNTIVDAHYRFTNRGKSPLIITQVNGSSRSVCPSYPKEPIAPGKSAEITVLFHTGGKIGRQDKTVTVTSNASEPIVVLHVKGYIILPPPLPKAPALVPEVKSGQ